MNQYQQNMDPIDAISNGYRQAQVLFTANRLDIFSTLGEQSLSSEELAEKLKADPRAMRILCDALVAIGVLDKSEGVYRNNQLSKVYLLPDSQQNKIGILRHGAKLYETWGRLFDVVLTGKPVACESIDPRLQGDERIFAQAMADVGRVSAKMTAEALDLRRVKKALDVGGGPGLYAIAFAQKQPDLQVYILDNEKTLQVAQENITRAGLEDQVHPLPGDALQDEYGEGYDFILLSNFIHIYSSETNAGVIQKCARALAPNGRVCVKDFILDENRVHPPGGALFAINMLVNTEEGDCYTAEDVSKWYEQAGLVYEETIELTEQSRLVIGRKK